MGKMITYLGHNIIISLRIYPRRDLTVLNLVSNVIITES